MRSLRRALRWAVLPAALSCTAPPSARGEPFLVKAGKAEAEIVIAERPKRAVSLAARELRAYIERISGAKPAVVTKPTGQVPVAIYVGDSPHTERLGLKSDNLRYGAYRMVSGENWLALIGHDSDFTPREPWARSHSDWIQRRRAEWDRLTGAKWASPGQSRLYKQYTGRAWDFHKPKAERRDKSDTPQVWAFDERGSLNAVYGFLRSLGVRWYMPGELGEVVPRRATIALPRIDETVRPDFAIRRFNFRFGVQDRDVGLWAMRLGVRDPYGVHVAHGMALVTAREEMKKAHPEYYALYGGRRATDRNQLCLSCPALLKENVRFVRKVFDIYGFSVVSVMPNDGFTSICQCALCKGKDTPQRGYRGRLSDYVWDYVNRVAKEVAKTHPHKKVLCCAYGAYQQPPVKIDKLNSNVLVCIVGGRRPTASKPEQREEIRKLRRAWLRKTDNPILIFENYPFTRRGWYLPSYVPHVIGESIHAVKGIARGEDIWFSPGRDFHAPGYNHFNIYFTARMYWAGGRGVDELFDEYCRLFYGPAEKEMKAFFEYCEANWQEMRTDKQKVDRCLQLFSAARGKVERDSVWGKRIALIADYLEALRNRSKQLGRGRGPVPELRLARDAAGIRLDGKLDEPFWRDCPYHARGKLRELQTGRKPVFKTAFMAAWGKDGLYFAIRCSDRKTGTVNVATKRNDDPAIWYGDAVEILLETDSHSYYQIAINPAGAIADLDRQDAKARRFQWNSQAQVAAHVGTDEWTVEVRIPVTGDANDPLHQVVGRKPIKDLPWYFNVCRQRVRENGAEYSAFSPTGDKSFHKVLKFAKLYAK